MNGRLALGLLLFCAAAGAATPPNDPHYRGQGAWGQDFDDQWALKTQRLYAAIAPAAAAERIIVAVIDTGLDYTHEDLAAEKIWRNPHEQKNGRDDDGNGLADDLIGWNFVANNNNPWDESGHGTHIGGLIAACTDNGLGIAGLNPDARIMPLKVANFIGQARSSAVAAAIRYAVDQGARLINLSLGGELVTDLEQQAAEYAAANGVLIIVAAGNRGISDEHQGYSGLPGVLVVGAADQAGARAGFSNFGSRLSLLAPGVDVLSLRARDTDFIGLTDPHDYQPGAAVVGESERYYRASGTSFAAALVTGVASRVLSQRPDLTAQELRNLLEQSARDLAPEGVDQLSGYGQIDYIGALAAPPDQFVRARLAGAKLALDQSELWVEVFGTAAAAQFASAELQLRAVPGSIPAAPVPEDRRDRGRKDRKRRGEAQQPEPGTQWQTIATLSAPIEGERLQRFSVSELTEKAGGSVQWELKLVVRDVRGQSRQAAMQMALPRPEPAVLAQEGDNDE